MSNWPGDCSQLVQQQQQQQQQQQAMANNYQQNYNPSISHAGMAMTMNPMTATIKREPMPYSSSCSGNTAPSSYGGAVPQLQPRTTVASMTQQQQPRPPQQQHPQPPTTSNEAIYYNYSNAQANSVARMYQTVGAQAQNNLHYQNSNNPNLRLYQSSSSSPSGQAVHYQRASPNDSNVSIQFQNPSPQQQQQQPPTNNITIRYPNPTANISGVRYQTPVSQPNPNVHYVTQQPANTAAALQIVNQLRQQQSNKQFIQDLRHPSLSALLLGKANQVPGQNTNFAQPNQNYSNNQPTAANINVHTLAQKAKQQPQPPPYSTNNAQRAYPPVSQQGLQYGSKRPMLTQSEKESQFMSQQQMMPTLNQLLQANPFAALNANKAAVNRQQQAQFAQHTANTYRIHSNIAQAPNVTVQMYNQPQNTYSMNTNPPKVPTTAMPPPAMNTLGNYAETPSSFSMWHKPSQWNTTPETYPETQQPQQTKPQPTQPQNENEQNLGVISSPPTVTDKAIVPTTVMSNTFPTTFLDGSGTGAANVSLQQPHPQPTSSSSSSSSSSSFMSNNMPMPPLSSSASSTTTSSSSSSSTTTTSAVAAPIQTDKEASLSDKMTIDEDLQLPAIDDLSNIVRQIIDDCWADTDFDHRTFDSPELILGIDSKTSSQTYNTDKDGKATNKCIQLSQNKLSNRIKDIPNDMQVMKDLETAPTGNTAGHNLRQPSTQEPEKEPEEEGMSDITESDLRALLTKKDKLPVVHVGTCGPELVIEMVVTNSQDLIKQLGEVKG